MGKKARNDDAVSILHRRYVKDDSKRKELEKMNGDFKKRLGKKKLSRPIKPLEIYSSLDRESDKPHFFVDVSPRCVVH